ncbi:MAG: hypothetical protein ACQETH_12675 [Candidatus Rifleibacteriota bacterium]
MTDSEKKLKLDINSLSEQFFAGMAVLSFLAIVAATVMFFSSGFNSFSLSLFASGAILLFLFVKLCMSIDNYYLIDSVEKKIFYNFKIFSYQKLTGFVDFDQIGSITITGHRKPGPEYTEWDYQIVLLTKNGKSYAISRARQEKFGEVLELGKNVAQLTCAEFIEPPEETIAEVKKARDGNFIFTHRQAVFVDAFKQNLKVFVVVVVTIIIALLLYEYLN